MPIERKLCPTKKVPTWTALHRSQNVSLKRAAEIGDYINPD